MGDNIKDTNNNSNIGIENNIENSVIIIEKKKRGRKKSVKLQEEKSLQKESNDIIEPLLEKKVRKRRSKKSMNGDGSGGDVGSGGGGGSGDGNEVGGSNNNDTKNVESPVMVKVRKRRVCKSKNNTNKDSNIVIDSNNSENNETQNDVIVHEEKVAKKRGRKPKGGKIITQKLEENNNNNELPNIILHLKCSLNDIKNPKDDNLSSYNMDENNIHNYNSSSQLKGSELYNMETTKVSTSLMQGSISISNYNENVTSASGHLFKVYDPTITPMPMPMPVAEPGPGSGPGSGPGPGLGLSTSLRSNNLLDNYIIADNNETLNKKSALFTGVYSPHINLYDNDYDECSNEDGIKGECKSEKEIWRKINQLKVSFHKSDICNNMGGTQRSACFWCTCEFDSPAIYIPKTLTKDVYNVYGCFCSPECAAAFLMNENIDTSTKFERYHLLNSLYGKIYKYEKSIKIAPNPFYLLNKFYGNLTIQEYRKLFQSDQMIYVVNKPLTHILPELYEDNNDFLLNNKIIPTNAVNIKKNKPLKSNIINNAFGITVGGN
jgi:galactitol-specific phosphotransferase system IIB component